MRTQKIDFPNQQAFCVFPDERSDLEQAISELQLDGQLSRYCIDRRWH